MPQDLSSQADGRRGVDFRFVQHFSCEDGSVNFQALSMPDQKQNAFVLYMLSIICGYHIRFTVGRPRISSKMVSENHIKNVPVAGSQNCI